MTRKTSDNDIAIDQQISLPAVMLVMAGQERVPPLTAWRHAQFIASFSPQSKPTWSACSAATLFDEALVILIPSPFTNTAHCTVCAVATCSSGLCWLAWKATHLTVVALLHMPTYYSSLFHTQTRTCMKQGIEVRGYGQQCRNCRVGWWVGG